MLTLGYDTATPWGTMALIDEEEIIFEITLKAGKGGGEYLLALLDTLLKKTGRKISDLDLISVGTGPGSYTGIRVGLAAAKGLAMGLHNRVFGIGTLRIIAENASRSSEWIASVIDARRGNIYSALFQNKLGKLIEVDSPTIMQADDFALRIADLPSVILCGDGSKIYQRIWQKYSNLTIAPLDWDRPSGAAAARIGRKTFDFRDPSNIPELEPCYLRKVEAEIRMEENLHAMEDRSNAGRRS